ncbi:transcriptional regulator [Rhodococcus sp. 1163]|uniref:IclR family transcriptional regulator n=1 Tax=Rhodococcus sp. 1163 TaxID=1905289 RepID=UPI000A022704|nr:IclR family transcriptional regulator [Rhodococcus sp. 1163]ORI11932.1 transcriptional regulator [Rhodococcus sp. 1163]
MQPHGSDEPPTGVLRRAARILDTFEAQAGGLAGGLNLTQVVAATGLPVSSVHRALEQMVSLRWLHRQGMEYRLGMRLTELGSAAADADALRQAALPSLRWLHHNTGFVVHLGVLDGTDVVYLEKIGGESIPDIQSRVGSRMPAHSSTIGKALLALDRTVDAERSEIDQVRESRIAYARERCIKGFSCVAAPIGPQRWGDAAAISVFGATARVDTDEQLRMSLQAAAADIWRRLNTQRSPMKASVLDARAPRCGLPR